MESMQGPISIPNTLDPILWVRSECQTKLPHFFVFGKDEIEIVQRASFTEALLLLSNRKFSVVIAEENEDGAGLGFLIQARLLQPMAPRFYISNDISERWIRDGINKAQIFRFIKGPANEGDLRKHLEKAVQKHSIYLSRSLLLREASHQNKQLEALTNSLEKMVEERTQYIEMSHREESEKLSRERQLIRFIKDLATQTSFEDILIILRKELRKFHKIGDPILVYRSESDKTYFLSFQSGNFTQTEALLNFEFPKSAGKPPADLMRHFANHFGRPFAKAYLLPVELRLTRHLSSGKGEALLCIENSLNDKELSPFIDFMNDRMGPLGMALDRVLIESQLSAFSYRWEKTFDGMRDPIAIVDLEYNVIRANRKFSDKLLHHKCFTSFAHRDESCTGCPVPAALKEGAPQVGQVSVDGRIYQVHSYPIRVDHGGKATNVVNQYVDITQSRELYLRMLQNEKMGAIGMLAGNIAHELNNPLTGLRSLSQVLLNEVPADSTIHADLVEIEKAAGRSQRIIKNLLEFSKGEDQSSEYISIDEVVERTLPMLKSALRAHRLELDLQTLGKTVYVESHLLQQVVFNLVNNACQAMRDTGRVRLSTRFEKNQVILEVADSGPGIPESISERIFEPFFTTKKEGHGTGLGLSMARQVVEKFGGSIDLKKVDEGACFVIRLPHCEQPRK